MTTYEKIKDFIDEYLLILLFALVAISILIILVISTYSTYLKDINYGYSKDVGNCIDMKAGLIQIDSKGVKCFDSTGFEIYSNQIK